MSDFITNAELRIESERLCDENERLEAENAELRHDLEEANNQAEEVCIENAKLRELVRGLHMAYVGTLNECESLDEGLIWECSGNIDADVAKSRAKFKADRHRFDAALRELGVEK